jgi:integrase
MHLDPFFTQTGKNPDEFRKWARNQDELEIDDLIADFTKDLKHGAAYNATTALRSFCSHNAIGLPKSTAKYTNEKQYRPYTRAEIHTLLSYLDDPIHKLYVTLAKDTGLRAKHTLQLQYRHIKQDYEANLPSVAIRFDDQEYHKRKAAGLTFFGDETRKLLHECIQKNKINQQDNERIFKVRYNAVFDWLNVARKKADIKSDVQPSHGLRKFFINTLEESGITSDKLDFISGDYGGSTIKQNYLTRRQEELRPLYEKAYDHLRTETDPEIQQQFQDQQSEIKTLKQQLTDLTEKYTDLFTKVIPDIQKQYFTSQTIQTITPLPTEDEQLEKAFKTLPPTIPIEKLKQAYYNIVDLLTPEEKRYLQSGEITPTITNKLLTKLLTDPNLK